MIADYVDARDELFAQYQTILASTPAIIGESLKTVYQGVESGGKVPTNKFWARVSQQTVIEGQATLRGTDLTRRYRSEGLIFVQLFGAKDLIEDYAKLTKLGALIKTAFRGKQTNGCIWFRNTRIQELPNEDAWYRLNVVSEYTYDEIG